MYPAGNSRQQVAIIVCSSQVNALHQQALDQQLQQPVRSNIRLRFRVVTMRIGYTGVQIVRVRSCTCTWSTALTIVITIVAIYRPNTINHHSYCSRTLFVIVHKHICWTLGYYSQLYGRQSRVSDVNKTKFLGPRPSEVNKDTNWRI